MPDVTMTWANRKYDPETPELVCAWDEYSIDSNPEGWAEDKAEQIASWGDDLLNHVDVIVRVPYEAINERLNPPTLRIDGEVKDA